MKKKILAALLAALMLGGAAAVTAIAADDVIILNEENGYELNVSIWFYGDVNADSSTNVNDALQIQRYSAGKGSIFTSGDASTKEYRMEVADVNLDGKVNVNDALQIQRYSAGKGSVLDKLLP